MLFPEPCISPYKEYISLCLQYINIWIGFGGLHTYIFLVEKRDQNLLHVPLLDMSRQNHTNQAKGLVAGNVGCDERGKSILLTHVQFRFTSCMPSANSGMYCAPSHRSSVEDPEWNWTPGIHCYYCSPDSFCSTGHHVGPDTEPVFNPSRFSETG